VSACTLPALYHDTSWYDFVSVQVEQQPKMDHELILNDEPLVTLMHAAGSMDGVKFWHGTKKKNEVFRFVEIEAALRVCIELTEPPNLNPELLGVKTDLGKEKLAALFAWTSTPLCHALCSVLRAPHRTRESIKPALPYARLLFAALHALPERYIFKRGTLYRAENGVMDMWDEKMKVGGIFSFFTPTSFTQDAAVVSNFNGEGPRTVFEVHDASGWIMDDFNLYEEKEVLLEPVCNFEVLNAEKFDADHRMVLIGEIKAGLHHVVGHVRSGTELFSGSPVKEYEKDSYRVWQEQMQQREQPRTPVGVLNLDFYPFTEEEWANKGETLPRRDKERRMSFLGKGAFMSTYRKKTQGASAGEVCLYAVKTVEKDDMRRMRITQEDVRREARVLAQLRHRHIILYFGVEETEEEMGIVMELAEGGSLADFEYVDLKEVLIMTTQISNAMEYMHSQGVVHRDIKPDNILLSHTGAGAIQIKIADFGVAVLLATTSGSTALLSRAGTHQYFAPERAKGQSYGKMADMWSVGCVIIELLTPERLRDAIWDDGVEVSGRREQLIGHVEREDEGLGGIVRELLHLDKNFRLSAWSLKSNLYTRAAAEARTDTVIV
jgi:tRNA A-37 threonylcarbamoyl transferase component Bud32